MSEPVDLNLNNLDLWELRDMYAIAKACNDDYLEELQALRKVLDAARKIRLSLSPGTPWIEGSGELVDAITKLDALEGSQPHTGKRPSARAKARNRTPGSTTDTHRG